MLLLPAKEEPCSFTKGNGGFIERLPLYLLRCRKADDGMSTQAFASLQGPWPAQMVLSFPLIPTWSSCLYQSQAIFLCTFLVLFVQPGMWDSCFLQCSLSQYCTVECTGPSIPFMSESSIKFHNVTSEIQYGMRVSNTYCILTADLLCWFGFKGETGAILAASSLTYWQGRVTNISFGNQLSVRPSLWKTLWTPCNFCCCLLCLV